MQDEKKDQQESPPVDEGDVKAPTGAGMKIAITIIIVAAIAGALAAAYYFVLLPEQQRKQKLKKHQDFMASYTTIKTTGYDDFWKCVFPLAAEEQADNNFKLESIIKSAISQNEEGFGKHILECLEILKTHIKNAKEMEAPPEYQELVKEIPPVLQNVHDSWKALGDKFANAGQRNKWDKRLDEVATKGWGQMYVDYEKGKNSSDETMQNARRYMKFITCATGKTYTELGNTKAEVEKALVEHVMNDICATPEKAMERGKYIEDNCVAYLVSPDPPPADDDWAHVVKRGLYYETRSLSVIAGSWEGKQGCLRESRIESEKMMILNLFNAWLAYKKVAKSIEKAYLDNVKDLKK